METIKLNKVLFDLILYIQSVRLFRLRENELYGRKNDIWEYTENVYRAIPESVFDHAGIRQCDHNFREMWSFKVTEEMMNTQYSDLGKFDTPFWK